MHKRFLWSYLAIFVSLWPFVALGEEGLVTLKGHSSTVTSVFVSDGKIISGSSDKTIKIWDLSSGKLSNTLTGHLDGATSVFVSDGKIISGSWDGTIKIWDLASGKLLNTLTGHGVGSVFVSDGKIISGGGDGTIKIWDLANGKLLNTLKKQSQSYKSTANVFVSDGKIISGEGTTINIWDLASGNLLNTLKGHSNYVLTVFVSDGKIISGSSDETIKIWDLASGNLLNTLNGSGAVISVFVSDGKIISGSGDHTVKIWDLARGNLLNTLKGHSDMVDSVFVSDDKVISGSYDHTIKNWGSLRYILRQAFADKAAWDPALQANTLAAYERYLSKYPNGTYASEAKFAIDGIKFRNLLTSNQPQRMYVAGVRFENDNDRASAKRLYLAIIDRFPEHATAIQAAGRLTSMKDVELLESSNVRARQDAAERDQRNSYEAAQRDHQAAERNRRDKDAVAERDRQTMDRFCLGKSSCGSSCTGLKGDAHTRCFSSCWAQFSMCR